MGQSGDQFVQMFHDEVTHQIHLYRSAMQYYSRFRTALYLPLMRPGVFSMILLDQANNPCSTVQPLRGVSVFDKTLALLPHWTRPTTNAVLFKH